MNKKKIRLIEFLAFFASLIVFGISFDGFWHISRGRESFFVLPHLFIYLALAGAIICAHRVYKLTKQRAFLWLFRLLCIVPVTAAADEIWHRVRGKETIDSILIVLSPPHMIFFLVALISLMILTLEVREEKGYKNKIILGPFLLGMFLNILFIFTEPVSLFGPHQVFGAAGFGVWFAIYVFILFLAKKLFNSFASATLTGMTALLYQLVIFNSAFYVSQQHSFFHIPVWLQAIIFLFPALFTDYFTKLTDNMIKGSMLGIVSALVYFICVSIVPNNPYIFIDVWVGTLTAGVGGLVAGLVHDFVKYKTLEEDL